MSLFNNEFLFIINLVGNKQQKNSLVVIISHFLRTMRNF